MSVNKGVAENLCYDNYTALKDGTESMGHSMSKAGSSCYRGTSMPVNQVIKSGDATLDEMIADTKKGVYITRFWYFRAIRRDKAVITGLTRDACWFIEDGEIVHPMKVMRFTDSVMDVMSNIDLIGNRDTVQTFQRANIPMLKVAKLKFTGQSQF
jgi:PmbA protein